MESSAVILEPVRESLIVASDQRLTGQEQATGALHPTEPAS